MHSKYRMYEQAFETIKNEHIKYGDIIQPFNKKIIRTGICPTLTTRPEGFKTAILVVMHKKSR